jgi:PAS domain-containing protein
MKVLDRLFKMARRRRLPAGHVDFHRVVSRDTLAIGIDLAGHILGVSSAVEELTGYDEPELVGKSLEYFAPFVGKVPGREAIFPLARDKPRRVHTDMLALKTVSGKHIGFIVLIRDR